MKTKLNFLVVAVGTGMSQPITFTKITTGAIPNDNADGLGCT